MTGKSMQRLMIFAKAPIPGQAKTRLIPVLGPVGAARFHAACVRDVIERHTQAGRAITVWRAGPPEHPFWAELPPDVAFADQPTGDLGVRQATAFAATLAHGGPVVIVGADSPTLPPELVDLAFAALERVPAVVGPARDGGYYLLGLHRVAPDVLPAIFAGIPWSAPTTEGALSAGLARAGLAVERLATWYDLDEPADLEALTVRRFLLSPPLPHHTLATLDDLP